MERNKTSVIKHTLIIIVLLLLSIIPRFLQLESGWSYDESYWIKKSSQFITAIQCSEFAKTKLAYHPGVTTMWAGGIALALTGELPKRQNDNLSLEDLKRARLGIAVTTSLAIIGIYLLLCHLFSAQVAFLGCVFIALDPFYLGHSRIIHTDALLASCTTLSILSLLLYLKNPKKHFALVLSGIFSGLSVLTKTAGIVLFPYTFLTFFIYSLQRKRDSLLSTTNSIISGVLKPSLTWSATACLTFLAFWPATWGISIRLGETSLPILLLVLPVLLLMYYLGMKSSPSLKSKTDCFAMRLQSVKYLALLISAFIILSVGIARNIPSFFRSITWALTTPHENAGFFLGKVVRDPGPLFYFVVAVIKASPIVFILLLFSAIFYFRRENPQDESGRLRCTTRCYRVSETFRAPQRSHQKMSSLWLFVGMYTLAMTLVAKKLDRYLLPIFPILDILAALTLYQFVRSRKACAGGLLARASRNIALARARHGTADAMAPRRLRCTIAPRGKVFHFFQKRKFLVGYSPLEFMTKKTILLIILAFGFIFQAYACFSPHPYYFAYYNPLLLGPKIAPKIITIGRGEGMDKAAEYLNKKTDALTLTVAGDPTSFLRGSDTLKLKPYLKSRLLKTPQNADYIVLYISDIQTGTPLALQYYPHQVPEHIVKINGINYVWIYRNKAG